MGKAEEELKVIGSLKKISSLSNFLVLDKKDREHILDNEEKSNLGVLEAVKRKHLIAFTHNSDFREPAGEIVMEKDGRKMFPPVPFPEVKKENVVSCSPGYKIDHYLKNKMKDVKKDDATLMVGFD